MERAGEIGRMLSREQITPEALQQAKASAKLMNRTKRPARPKRLKHSLTEARQNGARHEQPRHPTVTPPAQ